MIKAIIFDFAGPIIAWDNEAIYKKHEVERALEVGSISEVMDKYFHCANRGEYEDIFDFYKKAKPSINLTASQLNDILQETQSTFRVRTEMINYIKELKKKYKIAILSNFTDKLEKLLEDTFNISHLFDVVVCSYNLKMSKPDPKIYYYALKKLNVKASEAVFIDDMKRNTEAAEKLGIKSVVFVDFKQCKKNLQEIL